MKGQGIVGDTCNVTCLLDSFDCSCCIINVLSVQYSLQFALVEFPKFHRSSMNIIMIR